MSVEDNIAVVRGHLDALSSGDVEGAVACWAPVAQNHSHPVNRDAIHRVMESLCALRERHTIEEIVATGDAVVCRTTCQGVHAAAPELPGNGGILVGVPPTRREYIVQRIHIFHVKDGLIVAHFANRDDLGMARQLAFRIEPPEPLP